VCKHNHVLTAPAKACSANLEIVGWEWRSGCTQCLEEGEDAGFADRAAGSDNIGNRRGHCFEDEERFVEDGGKPGSGRGDSSEESHGTNVHRMACKMC